MRLRLVQAASTHDVDRDLERVAAEVRAAPRGALVVLPELFVGGYQTDRASCVAVGLDDPRITALRDTAARSGVAVMVGFSERRPGDVANSVLCIDEAGAVAAVHRKCVMFDAGERAAFAVGDAVTVATVLGVRVGILICFELEFPELARQAAAQGAEVLVVASANHHPYGPEHELAGRARALDNRLPVAYVNLVGDRGDARFAGGTMTVSADGAIGIRLGSDEASVECRIAPGRAAASPDLDYVARIGELPVTRGTGTSTP